MASADHDNLNQSASHTCQCRLCLERQPTGPQHWVAVLDLEISDAPLIRMCARLLPMASCI